MEEVNQRGAVLWWLDEPIRRAVPLRYGFQFNPRLAWFTDRLPGRARTLLRKAALGELRDHDPGAARRIPPARTLRDLVGLPALTLLLQNRYGYGTHMLLCRAFRDNGFTGQLFGVDEATLRRSYPYVTQDKVGSNRGSGSAR